MGLLSACQDREARAETERLEARVAALEAQVQALKDVAGETGASGAGEVVARAAAQNCANDLDRFLETTRQDGDAYPPARLVTLPDSCVDLRVNWRTLTPNAYAFDVTDLAGRRLATGRGP